MKKKKLDYFLQLETRQLLHRVEVRGAVPAIFGFHLSSLPTPVWLFHSESSLSACPGPATATQSPTFTEFRFQVWPRVGVGASAGRKQPRWPVPFIHSHGVSAFPGTHLSPDPLYDLSIHCTPGIGQVSPSPTILRMQSWVS